MKRIITALVFLVGASQAQAMTKHMKGLYVGVGQDTFTHMATEKADGSTPIPFWAGKVGYVKVHMKKIGYGIEGVYGMTELGSSDETEKGVKMAVKPMLTYGLTRGSHIYVGAQLAKLTFAGKKEGAADAQETALQSYGGQVGLVARVYRNLSLEGEVGYHQYTLAEDNNHTAEAKASATTVGLGLRYTF